ncbi:hypothetical protein ACHAXH_004252 [Discostella pseudostelligera]
MPVIDKTQITRLENESKRFAKEIEQKQQENLLLREQVFSIRSQIEESQKIYEDISKGHQTAGDQQMKMKLIMEIRKIANDNDAREVEITDLRAQLKKLRMKTFPRFNPM